MTIKIIVKCDKNLEDDVLAEIEIFSTDLSEELGEAIEYEVNGVKASTEDE